MHRNTISRSLYYGCAALTASILVAGGVISGCGGSDSSSPATSQSATGRVVLITRWPDRNASTRVIPILTDELNIEIVSVSSGARLGNIRVPRPATGNESTTEFPAIPAGDVEIRIIAWKNGSLIPLASGNRQATVTAGEVTQARISLASTITRLQLSPTISEVRQAAQVQHSISAFDASGAIVPTAASTLQWSSSAASIATIDANGLLVAHRGGNTRVTVRETESGIEAFYDVTVIPNDPSTQVPPTYILTELPNTADVTILDAYAINDFSQVVGTANNSQSSKRGFLWQNGNYTVIPPPPGETYSTARDINNRGQVVGGSATQAFIWDRGTMTPFKVTFPFAPATSLVEGEAINESGTVVGRYFGRDTNRAFRRMANGTIDMGASFYVQQSYRIADINESNDAIVNYFTGVPIRWTADGTVYTLSTMGSISAINDMGTAVGAATTTQYRAAVVWNPDRTELPGTQHGYAVDINNGGLIVGYTENYSTYKAFVTKAGKEAVYLDNLSIVNGEGWQFQRAYGINSRGQIVGTGMKNWVRQGFVLTPKFN